MSTTMKSGAQNRHYDEQTSNAEAFLMYARVREYPLTGTIASGAAGGSPTSNVNFTADIPEVPAYAKSITFEITLPIALTLPANSTAKVSHYFPHSAMLMKLTLAGSPAWDQISLVPWFLDDTTDARAFDQAASGVVPGAEAGQADAGPFVYADGGFVPGATITNATGAPVTTNGTVTFRSHVRLQRHPKLMFGCIPMGDPENRPEITMQLAQLVGSSPESNAFQDPGGFGVTAVLSGVATVNAIIDGLSLDVLPDGTPDIPQPIVGMGLAVTAFQKTQQNAGQLIQVSHKAAMLYEKIMHLFFNGQIAIRSDYFGNWLTQEQQSARWEYDASAGTYNQLYEHIIKTYHRYFPKGCYIVDLVDGMDPDDPTRDPYHALQTPDTAYAAEFDIAATPAWTTALRAPSGTAMSGCYIAVYEFGTVNVPY